VVVDNRLGNDEDSAGQEEKSPGAS